MKRIFVISALLFTLMLSFNAYAQAILSAPEALEKVQSGEIILLDIRSPQEWKETGIASVAVPLSMHERGFLEGLEKIKQENADKEIALICATGGRSVFLQAELKKRGLGDTINISEGMMGNGKDAGWIRRGLPVKAYEK